MDITKCYTQCTEFPNVSNTNNLFYEIYLEDIWLFCTRYYIKNKKDGPWPQNQISKENK